MANFGNIGEAFVDIRANFNKFQSDLRGAQAKVGKNLGTIGRSFQTAGRSLTLGLTLPLVAAAAAVIKMGVSFEKEMTKIQTLVGIAAVDVDKMGTSVLQLAKDTARGPQELAKALFVVTSAGARGAVAMEILEQAAKASAIGLGDTAEIARAVTSAVNAYGEANLSATRATEILVATVREGNLEASDLAGSLGRVIGIAANVGLTFDQVGSFIATFTRVGVSAEEAVTSLRGALAILVKPTKGVEDALASIGTTVEQLRKDVVEKGIAQAFGDLIKQLEGAGIAVAEVFPNIRALSGVLATAGSQGEEFIRISLAIANSQGIVREGFEQTRKTAAFVFGQVFTELKSITAELGLALIPLLKDSLLPLLRGMVKSMGLAAKAFQALPRPLQNIVAGFVALLAAAGPFLFIFGGVARGAGAVLLVLSKFGISFGGASSGVLSFGGIIAKIGSILTGTLGPALQSVLAFLSGPVGWVVAIIAVIAIITKWAASAEALTRAWDAVKNFFSVLGRFIVGVFGKIVEGVKKDIDGILTTIGPAIAGLKSILQPVVDFFLNAFTGALNAAAGAILLISDALGIVTPEIESAKDVVGAFAEESSKAAAAGEDMADKMEKAAAAGKILVPGMERSAAATADAAAASQALADAAEDLAKAQATAAQATLDALNPFSQIIEQWNLASAAGTTATQFTAAFRDQIVSAGIEAEKSAELFEALGLSIDDLPQPLQEALAGLIATEKATRDVSQLFTEMLDLPLARSTEDFAAALKNLQGPQSESFKTAQRTNEAQKELNRAYNLSAIEIDALEKEIQAYIDANATAAQIQDKFGDRIAAADKRAKLFNQTLGEGTEAFNENRKAAERNADFAQNFQDAWNTAIGSVLGNFLKSIQTMDFSFRGFFDSIVDTAKNLGRTLISLFASSIFKPILKIGQRFASNLADTIFSKLAGAKGPPGGLLGGLNIGGTFKGIGSTISGAFSKLAPLLTNPITGAIAGIGLAIFAAFKLFTQTPLEAGVKEVTRDFGVEVSKDALEGFTKGLGLTEEQFKPIRKDILSSPLAFRDLLLPAAQASGQVDELVASFGNLTAFGKTFDLSGAAAKAAAGDFTELNAAFAEIFGESGALKSVGGVDPFLVPDPDAAAAADGEPGVRTGELLGDIFVDRLDSLIEIMGAGFESLTEKLGEMVDRLTTLVEGPGQLSAEAGALAPGSVIEINIQALDAASFREFMAGDGGDVFMEELLLRRQEQMVEVVGSATKGIKE